VEVSGTIIFHAMKLVYYCVKHKKSVFMSYFYKELTTIFIMFLLASCGTNQKKFSPPTFEKQVKLKHTVIQDTLFLHPPEAIISFNKYILINVTAETDGKYLHVYDKQTGEYIGGYATKGQGPGEIATWCECIDYYRKEHIITLLEANTNQRFIYSVNDILENLLTYESKKNFSRNNIDNSRGFERLMGIFKISENLYLSDNRTFPLQNNNQRFALITETGERISEYSRFATDDFWAYGAVSQQISISPDRRKMACATLYGAVLETFEIGTSVSLIQEKLFYPIILGNTKSGLVVPTDETIQGFLDICTSDEYVFSIFIGSNFIGDKKPNKKNISVFNWNGDPVVRFETDIDLNRICYNEDDKMIYAVAITEDYDYILVKFDLSEYL